MPPSNGGLAWYDELREKYKPDPLVVLLIAESPPQSTAASRRFFYSPELSRHDNLYRGVATALYGSQESFDLQDKPGTLRRVQRDGYWLIDAVDRPINQEPVAERRRAIRARAPQLGKWCAELEPRRGVVICHQPVYELAADAIRDAGVSVLHDEPLPFPLGNWRAEFIARFRVAVA